MMVENIRETRTLTALLHASPLLYRHYIKIIEVIRSQVTVKELFDRGIDLLTPANIIDIDLEGGFNDGWTRTYKALEFIYNQTVVQEMPERAIVLDLEDCAALLRIRSMRK